MLEGFGILCPLSLLDTAQNLLVNEEVLVRLY